MKVIIREPVFCHDVVVQPEVQLDEDGNAKFGGFNPVLQPSETPVEVPDAIASDWIRRGIAAAHEESAHEESESEDTETPTRGKKKGF